MFCLARLSLPATGKRDDEAEAVEGCVQPSPWTDSGVRRL